MTKTKRRILDTALALYNTNGLAKVSQRMICEQLGMSPGNLTYHFKRKEEIEEALYFDLVATFDKLFASMYAEEISSAQIRAYGEESFLVTLRYRFVFQDFVQLMRRNDRIREHYQQLVMLRKQQFLGLLSLLAERGFLREEEIPGEYEGLYFRTQVLSDFFFSAMEIQDGGVTEAHKELYANQFLLAFYPYLTATGRKVAGLDQS